MKPRAKRFLQVFAIATVLVACLVREALSPNSFVNRASAMNCTLKWGRLAPFPTSAQHIKITAEGSMFTRVFHMSFEAPQEDIEQWLKNSLGTKEAEQSLSSPGVRHFEIKPGEGAMLAWVTVDDTHHRVTIYVCWS